MKIWEIDTLHGMQYKDDYGRLWIFDDCGYLVDSDGRDITEMYSSKDLLYLVFENHIDWTKITVDTPIYVRASECDTWEKRYFASFKGAMIYAYNDGQTKWTSGGKMFPWKYAKLVVDSDR